MGLVGDRIVFPTGDRETLPAGDRTSDSSQGKTVNLLLGVSDQIGRRSHCIPNGRSPPCIFSRENREPVIGKKSWDLWVIAPQILLKGKL